MIEELNQILFLGESGYSINDERFESRNKSSRLCRKKSLVMISSASYVLCRLGRRRLVLYLSVLGKTILRAQK
jgi:hypothetical protein